MALTAAIDLTVKKPDFKGLKAEIQELSKAAEQAVHTFGGFSPEALAATKALAEAKSSMEDFNDQISAINPNKFARIGTVISGIANGFATAQGAMALFGDDSKDLEKTMVKLQGAMALSQGLEGLGKIQKQFETIFDDVLDGAKKAFAAIKAGIGSTGIGLLVVALGSIVAYWDEISASLFKVNKEEERHLKLTKDLNDAISEQIKSNQVRKTDLLSLNAVVQNSSNSEETRNGALRQLQTLLPNLKTEELGRAGALERINKEVKLGIQLIDLQIRAEGVKAVAVAKATEIAQNNATIRAKQLANERIIASDLNKNILDKQGGELGRRQEIEALQKSNIALTSEYTALTADLNVALAAVIEQENALGLKQEVKKEVIVKVAKTAEQLAKEEAERLAKIEAERVRLLDQRVSAELGANEALRQSELAKIADEGERIQKQFSNKIASLQEAHIQEQIAAAGNAEALALIDKKYEDLRIVAIAETDAAELALQQKNVDAALKIDEDAKAKQKVIDDQALADKALHEQQMHDLIVDSLMSTIGTLTALNTQHDILSEAAAKKSFERQKALGIAEALISTYFTAQKAYESQFKPSADASSPIRGAIAAAFSVAQGLAKVAIIRNKTYTSKSAGAAPSGGGQMGGGGMPQMSAPRIGSTLPPVGQFDTKVFVTEGDIRRTSNRVDSTKKVSVVK